MKCLHVIHTYSPSVGGTQWLFQNISERLVSEYGDEVTVFTTTAYTKRLFWDPREPSLPTGEELVNGVNVRRFPVFNRLSWLRLNAARVAHKLRLPGEDWLRERPTPFQENTPRSPQAPSTLLATRLPR